MKNELLPIMADSGIRRERIREKIKEGLSESFPVHARNKSIELQDVRVLEKDFSPSEQKKAILSGDTLFESVKGTVIMRDKDGQVLDEVPNFTLARVPWFTPRSTVIVAGNEYSVSNQVRPKPGVYARKRANGILEANFNTKGGSNFSITMDPAKGEPQLEYGASKIGLYPVLRTSGVSHDAIAKKWGASLANKNAKALIHKTDKEVDRLYRKVVPEYSRKNDASTNDKVADIFSRYARSEMDPTVTSRTLGRPYTAVTPDSLLDASSKILNVHRKTEEVDDRDNLDFKALYSADDFFKEVIKINARDIGRKAAIKMEANHSLRKSLPSGPFTSGILRFINGSQLVSVPTQTNPMELIDASMRVTALGEGGIKSERAIPDEARHVHATQLGALDPFRTPESFRAGIDVRAAMGVHKDRDGNIFVPLYRKGAKKVDFVRAGEIQDKIIAFPNQPTNGIIDGLRKGKLTRVPASSVDYTLPHPSMGYSPTTNLVPFMESLQGNRVVMGSKMATQALSLVDREEPYVQVQSPDGRSFEEHMSSLINPTTPVSGTIKKIDSDYVYIQPDKIKTSVDGSSLIKVPYETNFPLAAKTYLNHDLKIKEGDHVSANQQIAHSNFTKGNKLALGRNLSVAYMPYRGANSNDAVVISESAANKLTSQRMYKITMNVTPDVTLGKERHKSYYGHSYSANQYSTLDKDGVAKPGIKVSYGDPLILGLSKTQMTADDVMLGRLHKSLVKPFREQTEIWDHDTEGEVIDVVKTPKRITLTVKTKEPMRIGDKMSARAGNKGVVSRIISDDEMVKDEAGKPVDVIMTSAGIVSRTNPGVLIETAVGKVAEKTGKPILVEALTGRDNVKWAKDLLKKHNIKDKETVFDPVADKKIPNVFVGRQYIMKLMKSTDTNFSARSLGGYDVNQQPTKGGITGAKALGKMEVEALIAHNARNVLREGSAVRSQKNDEYWRAVQLGLPTPPPKTSFAYDKFLGMLQGAGTRVHRDGTRMSLLPLTDKDVEKMSSGPIKNPSIVKAKSGMILPERGGLFDPVTTGGLSGNKWSHIDLAEPIVSPTFREPVRRFLGMTNPELDRVVSEKGGAYIRNKLSKIDLDKHEATLRKSMKGKKAASLDNEIKQLKYIKALKSQNLRPDQAYVVSKVPVVPPVFRPVLPGKGGQDILYGDINPLYRDLLYVDSQFKEVKKSGALPSDVKKLRKSLHDSVGAVYGVNEPVTAKSKSRGHKGFLTYISGVNSPKSGYFHSKLVSKSQDVAGRGTIIPDSTLGMDEVGLPETMMWGMYDKFVIKKLIQQGYPAVQAAQMVKDRHPAAKRALDVETTERPVMVNRAPTLHRFNIVGAYPKMVPGKTIRVNPFIEEGTNSDYDGDCCDCDIDAIVDGYYTRLHISEFPHNKESVVVKGNKELYEVKENVKVFGFSEKEQRVTLCDVSHFSIHYNLEMVEVTTTSGRKTKVSRDHSMFGLNLNSGKLERFKAEEGIGWGTPRARKLFCTDQLNNITLHNKELFNVVELTEDLGWLLGTWAGNGWISYAGKYGDSIDPCLLGLGKTNLDVKRKFIDIVHSYDSNISMMAQLTEKCRGAENKHLPSYFVQAPKDFLLGLFAGLLDSAGSVTQVKAKNKNKSQWMVQYTTISKVLAEHVSLVATMLGVRSNISEHTRKNTEKTQYQISFSVPDISNLKDNIPCASKRCIKGLKAIKEKTFDLSHSANSRYDIVPIPIELAKELRKLTGNPRLPKDATEEQKTQIKAVKCRYQKLTKAVKEGKITRAALYECIRVLGVETVNLFSVGDWYSLVTNEDIIWDFIKEVKPLEGRHTAWDLTVPDGKTFMTSNQLIVYDTFMVHAPVSPAAVEEVKGMTLSNLLYSDKSRNDLLVFPQHEAIMGIAHASAADEKNKPIRFKTKADALKAYKEGKITLGTRIQIG